MRIADPDNFPNLGLAVWWALQTVTTVGYGDVVPTTVFGRVVGGIEMVLGVSFIAFLTAGVTSTVIQRREAGTAEDERAQREREVETILDALARDETGDRGPRRATRRDRVTTRRLSGLRSGLLRRDLRDVDVVGAAEDGAGEVGRRDEGLRRLDQRDERPARVQRQLDLLVERLSRGGRCRDERLRGELLDRRIAACRPTDVERDRACPGVNTR